jgi:hypothetical protein
LVSDRWEIAVARLTPLAVLFVAAPPVAAAPDDPYAAFAPAPQAPAAREDPRAAQRQELAGSSRLGLQVQLGIPAKHSLRIDDQPSDAEREGSTAASGLEGRYDQAIGEMFSLAGLIRWSMWNTELDSDLGYGPKEFIDFALAPGIRAHPFGRYRFRSQLYLYAPIGLTLSYMNADIPRQAVEESVDDAVGYTYGLVGGWALLFRKPILLHFELGIVTHHVTHVWSYAAVAPPEDRSQHEHQHRVTWFTASVGFSFAL